MEMMEMKRSVCEEELEDVKWVKHYSSMHQILLVGEGDFSFSRSLANAFGSAINIVATSHDTYDNLLKKYSKAQSNVEELKTMGASIIHEVDATNMKLHAGLRTRKFDRIVFNFPHAGFKGKEVHPQLIKLHRQLVRGFFRNASRMLWPYGEVHVSHKTAAPFSHWNLEELAADNSLLLVECADFCIEDYPGYNNKRGDGSRSDIPFHLGKCSTFKFIIGQLHRKKNYSTKADLLPSPHSFSPVMADHLGYGNNAVASFHHADISYPEIRFPFNFERIPRSINSLAFRETTLPPLCRINNFSLRMHEPEFSSFAGVSLRIRVPLASSYYTELLDAPRRAFLGYDYLRRYEELHSRGGSFLECGSVLERRVLWDEEAHQRWLHLCHGI